MILRRATHADAPAVWDVHRAAFERALEADLAERLRTDGDLLPALCFVAVAGDDVVGNVAVSRGRVGDAPVPALGPIGVLPAHQGRGIGSALVHAVIGGAEALGEQCVALLGSPGYYGRFGFGPSAPLEPPDPAWGEHFQVRRLTAWDGSLRGVFRYAAAFPDD
ncbi:MAG TPA: N-acetyltransferase [Frankiaceae bacterium]|nr:N-acetyltransferase [Frankiaceae bacterium]